MNPIETLVKEIERQNLWTQEILLRRNEFLTKEGKVDTNLYFVVEGALRIYVIDEYEEHTIRFGYEDNLIAALDSFIKEEKTELYIQALKKTAVKVINKQSFIDLITADEQFKETWLLVLESFVIQQMERERDILINSPLERYRRVLKRSPQLFQEIPHKYIASYLRMSPETLSRIKKS